MNKLSLFFSGLLMIFPTVSFSEKVTININANVIERSCTISNDSLKLTVELQPGDLKGKKIGTPFAGTPFSISLVDCPANLSSAHLTFSGESDTTMGNLLKNTNETDAAAKGVALGLYDTDNNNLDIKNNKKTITLNHSLDKNTFNFLAYYVKTDNKPGAGNITSIADFELAYD